MMRMQARMMNESGYAMKSLHTLTFMTALIATLGFTTMSHAQTSMYKNQDNTVTFHSAGEGQNQVRNGTPVSKTYVKNTDGTVTFQETQVTPAEGQQVQQPVVVAPPVAVPYPIQPYQPMVAPYPRQVQPQPNILP
ncbi:MAG: hypothetical protein AB7E85_00005, partial [Pseudobdellovibrionaceae bacterium]